MRLDVKGSGNHRGDHHQLDNTTYPMLHLQSNGHLILRSTRLCARRCVLLHVKRYSTTATADPAMSVAVLGGGITGLSAAWYLSKFAPGVSITLFEQSSRLGGWLRSKQVEHEGETVLFEQGPRTLRPWTVAGLVTIDMIRQLGLEPELLIIPKTSLAAKNRFIYYPDRLNKLPSDVLSALLSPRLPVMRGVFSGLFAEPFRKRRSSDLDDESVGSFLARRFNKNLANNLVSAVLHGIYAGDVDKLSAKSLFPGLWRGEQVYGSLARSLFGGRKEELLEDQLLRAELYRDNLDICARMGNASVYTFKKGIETLSLALARELEASPNVTIRTSYNVKGISFNVGQPFPVQVTHPTHRTHYTSLISTLSAPSLASLLPSSSLSPALSAISAVTVLVVNLYFSTPSLLPVKGFGYLIPKSVPPSQNPENALGVIFDSDTAGTNPHPGTKVTVMMGGHYWSGRSSYPDEEAAVKMATAVLARHLRITEKPVLSNVTLQSNCIPQYHVGHDERLRRAHADLTRGFSGRVAVAGSSFGGVGLNDCIRGAREVAKKMAESGADVTGLERWAQEDRWVNKIEPK